MTTARKSKKTAGKESFPAEAPEFIVEKILDKEIRNGESFYFLQWLGFDESHNSWEPFKNVDGLILLEEFEKEWSEKQNNRKSGGDGRRQRRKSRKEGANSPVKTSTSGTPTSQTNDKIAQNGDGVRNTFQATGGTAQTREVLPGSEAKDSHRNGFELGLEPEYIIGAMKECGVIYFLIKWKDVADPGVLVSNRIAKEKCPQLVFEFYEERLSWPEIAKA